jgi:hypothetical protein
MERLLLDSAFWVWLFFNSFLSGLCLQIFSCGVALHKPSPSFSNFFALSLSHCVALKLHQNIQCSLNVLCTFRVFAYAVFSTYSVTPSSVPSVNDKLFILFFFFPPFFWWHCSLNSGLCKLYILQDLVQRSGSLLLEDFLDFNIYSLTSAKANLFSPLCLHSILFIPLF